MKENSCVFDETIECPVRKTFREIMKNEKTLEKYLKPLGDTELLKMYAPIFEKLTSMLSNEFGILYNYCQICVELR